MGKTAVLFIAQGFGFGRMPFAPGTWGTLPGFAWFALLLAPGSLAAFIIGVFASVALSVWLCGAAEKILRRTDPGSVVLDEIVAVPVCYLPWVISEWLARHHAMPPISTFFSGKACLGSVAIFGLFRLFDVWKPWPIRPLQHLPGGWGVTVDDVVAGMFVALVTIAFVA